jgi:L-ascorbate metabolism protein UlaG (beta-lactamase superfamily)
LIDRLNYIGHATTLVRMDGFSVLTDPLLRRWLGPLRRQGPAPSADLPRSADAVLISHLHRDHLDLPSLRRLPPDIPLVVPRGAGRLVDRAGRGEILEIGRGETMSLGRIEVTAVPAVHDGRRDPWGGQPIEPLGYVIDGGGHRVYFAGDTDLFEGMSDLGQPDLALLPIWGWGPSIGTGHLDPARAARALKLIRPSAAVPIHWGTFYPIGLARLRPDPLSQPPREFERLAAEMAPDVRVEILQPGSEMLLTR